MFYSFYLALIVVGAGAVIIPGAPLLGIIFYSQVLNGALLPIVLVLMLLLINNKRLMGRWTNFADLQRHRLDNSDYRGCPRFGLDGTDRLPGIGQLAYSVSGARSAPIISAVFLRDEIAVADTRARFAAAGDAPITRLARLRARRRSRNVPSGAAQRAD